MAMVGRVRMLLIPKSIITLFVGKPFCLQPTTQTVEEVVAALRGLATKNCECLFDDGVLEIDLLPELGHNACRTIFHGRFLQGPEGNSLVGKFRYRLWVLGVHAWVMEYFNTTREARIRELLNAVFESSNSMHSELPSSPAAIP